jgi:hypothetical protein
LGVEMEMTKLKFFGAVFATGVLFASQAFPGIMKFKIHNESDYIINGFYTVDDGRTSDNWMDFKLSRGETGNMEFEFDGSCEIEFIVGWEAEDGSTIKGDNTTIDICKANNIYFDGDNATYD